MSDGTQIVKLKKDSQIACQGVLNLLLTCQMVSTCQMVTACQMRSKGSLHRKSSPPLLLVGGSLTPCDLMARCVGVYCSLQRKHVASNITCKVAPRSTVYQLLVVLLPLCWIDYVNFVPRGAISVIMTCCKRWSSCANVPVKRLILLLMIE